MRWSASWANASTDRSPDTAAAIATGSWSVAAAHGFFDAGGLPLDLALANARRIVGAVDLPVTIDFEGAYATDAETAAEPPAAGDAANEREVAS